MGWSQDPNPLPETWSPRFPEPETPQRRRQSQAEANTQGHHSYHKPKYTEIIPSPPHTHTHTFLTFWVKPEGIGELYYTVQDIEPEPPTHKG